MLQGSLGALSNRETLIQDMQVLDENGDAIDLTGATIVFELRDPNTKSSALTASTDDGKIVISTTTFTVTLDTDVTRGLCAKEYDAGITIEIDDVTTQLFAGSITIVDGVVS